jgi:hypothetical protein
MKKRKYASRFALAGSETTKKRANAKAHRIASFNSNFLFSKREDYHVLYAVPSTFDVAVELECTSTIPLFV